MKMRYGFILFIAIVLGISSCYEDKGNYTYKGLKKIDIEEMEQGITVTAGDTLKITPVFTYSSPDTVMNLKYTWTLDGKVIGNERNLVYVVNDIFKSTCFLKVEDVDNNVYFMLHVGVTVVYKYQKGGFLTLTEKDGKASLSFLSKDGEGYDESGQIDSLYFGVLADIYKKESGEDLNGKPVMVHEHFCSDYETKGQTLVVLDNGLVDINSLTFRKEVTGDQMFVGGWPAGMRPANVMFMQWADLIQDQDGQLYSRVKSTNELFNSEYFLPTPLSYEGKVLKKMNIVLGKFADCGYCLLYDGTNHRYLAYMDFKDNSGNSSVGQINPLSVANISGGGAYPEDFVPLENLGDYKLRYTGYWNDGNNGYFALLEKGGKYYHQEFVLVKDYSTTSIAIQDMSFHEISGLAGVINENSVIYALPYVGSGQYVFISSGKNLYLYDREVPENGVKPFYTFDGNVTCMDAEIYQSRCLGVGLDNGKVVVMKMNGAKNAQTKKEKVFWETPINTDLGAVKSIRYKVMSGNGWNPS